MPSANGGIEVRRYFEINSSDCLAFGYGLNKTALRRLENKPMDWDFLLREPGLAPGGLGLKEGGGLRLITVGLRHDKAAGLRRIKDPTIGYDGT